MNKVLTKSRDEILNLVEKVDSWTDKTFLPGWRLHGHDDNFGFEIVGEPRISALGREYGLKEVCIMAYARRGPNGHCVDHAYHMYDDSRAKKVYKEALKKFAKSVQVKARASS